MRGWIVLAAVLLLLFLLQLCDQLIDLGFIQTGRNPVGFNPVDRLRIEAAVKQLILIVGA